MVVDVVTAELDRVHERIAGRFSGGEPRLSAGRRRRVTFWAQRVFAAGSYLFGGLLVAGLLAVACSGRTAVSPGQQVSYQGYGGTAVVSVDGRMILVGPYRSGGCVAAVTVVARQSTARVALFFQSVPKPGGCPPPYENEAGVVPAQAIRLARPLGSRKLVNGATGRVIAWLSARLMLRPAVLPAGYRLTGVAPAVPYRLTRVAPGVSSVQAASPEPAGVTQSYSLPHGADPLEITQSAGSPQVPGPGPGGWITIRVRGNAGRATRNVITWRENGLTDFIEVGGLAGPDEPQLLTTRQLIAIADSARLNTGPLTGWHPRTTAGRA